MQLYNLYFLFILCNINITENKFLLKNVYQCLKKLKIKFECSFMRINNIFLGIYKFLAFLIISNNIIFCDFLILILKIFSFLEIKRKTENHTLLYVFTNMKFNLRKKIAFTFNDKYAGFSCFYRVESNIACSGIPFTIK